MIYDGFVGPAYTSQSPNVDDEALINWYVEGMESPGAKTPAALYPTPGYQTFATGTGSPGRGMFSQDGATGRAFAVIGYTLYEIASNGSLTDRGTLAQDTHPATFCWNGPVFNQLFITSGDHGYILDLTSNALSTVITSGCTMGAVFENYFLALDTSTSTLKVSALGNGLSWDPTQIAVRSAQPDPWVSMKVVHNEIWLFGSQTSEIWTDVGTFPFPFGPIPSAAFPQGTAAGFSVGQVDNTLMWFGQSDQGRGVIWRANGWAPERVSTHAVEFAIQGYATVSDAEAWVYQDQGHSFYVLDFPTANATWVYDTASNAWHTRGYWDTNTATYLVNRARAHCLAFGKHLVCDRASAIIYEQNITFASDVGGAAIRRVRRAPHLCREQRRTYYTRLQLDLETGLGLVNGTAPSVMLRWSNDGGHTWSNEATATATSGAQGQYTARVIFNRLGSARDRIFEVAVSDATAWRLCAAYLDVDLGLN